MKRSYSIKMDGSEKYKKKYPEIIINACHCDVIERRLRGIKCQYCIKQENEAKMTS